MNFQNCTKLYRNWPITQNCSFNDIASEIVN